MRAALGREVAAFRREIGARSDLGVGELDRLAVALALSEDDAVAPAPRAQSTRELSTAWEHVTDLDEGPVYTMLLSVLDGRAPDEARYAELLSLGYRRLEELFTHCDRDWSKLVQHWLDELGTAPAEAPTDRGPLEVVLGRTADGAQVRWVVNREVGNANVRIAGAPGTGKSQFLMYLLAAMGVREGGPGLILLDYKGDLSENEDFVRRCALRVVRPGDEPLPINPFQLPAGINPTLAPRAFAEVFASVSRASIGPVQLELLTRAMERAYEEATRHGEDYPTLAGVHQAVTEVYEEEGRAADSVIGDLRSLAGLGLFSARSTCTHEQAFRQRWLLDLSGLGTLRDFVAFVFLQYLAQAAQGLADSPFDVATHTRTLRGVVAVDEAHYYLKKRCAPLLQLIRIGRSKGLPVFLASQSLEDFKQHTELAELFALSILLKHGMPQDAKLLVGALGVDLDRARRASQSMTRLGQFEAYTGLVAAASEAPPVVRLNTFFELIRT